MQRGATRMIQLAVRLNSGLAQKSAASSFGHELRVPLARFRFYETLHNLISGLLQDLIIQRLEEVVSCKSACCDNRPFRFCSNIVTTLNGNDNAYLEVTNFGSHELLT